MLLAPQFVPARLALAAARPAPSAQAARITRAVQAAVNDSNCSTINIAAGTYTENITISRSVTLQGAGAASTILDGGRNGRVLNIPAAAAQVQLRDMTIQHGNIQSTYIYGSAIFNSGELAISNSIITDNWTDSSSSSSIYNNGSLTLSSSQVIKNHSQGYLGDIYNDTGTLTISHQLDQPESRERDLEWGGSATITGSTISANSGAGIINHSIFVSPDGITDIPYTATLTLTNSTISGNTSGGISNQGTYALGSIATLTNVTIGDNE